MRNENQKETAAFKKLYKELSAGKRFSNGKNYIYRNEKNYFEVSYNGSLVAVPATKENLLHFLMKWFCLKPCAFLKLYKAA